MKRAGKVCAVLAGVFLILYALPLVLLFGGGFLEALFAGELEAREVLSALFYLLFPAAGVFLILRKPKTAAVLMFAAALATAATSLPDVPNYLHETIMDRGEYPVYIPRFYVLLPFVSVLVPLLLALALRLRGWTALLLALLSAAAEVIETVLVFGRMGYITGHPSPLNVMLPFNFIMAAIFAGIYLLALGRGDGKEPGEKS